jgi:hypothetical protein
MALKKLFALAIIIGLTLQISLIPDAYNPIQLNFPSKDISGQTLSLRFQFIPNEPTISHRQVIGVRFPTTLSLTLNDASASSYTCSIRDETNGVDIKAEAAISDEANYLFCRLLIFDPLSFGITYNVSFVLGFKLNTSNFISNIGLFIASSELSNRLYFSSNPVFGNIGQYNDLFSNNVSLVDINSMNFDNKSMGGTDLVAGTICNISFLLQFNGYILSRDINIIVLFAPSIISAPTSVESASGSTSALGVGLLGSLTLSSFGNNGVLLNGITEDFVQGRTFRLNFKGFKVNQVGTSNIVVRIFYKNSFSVYANKSFAFTTTAAKLTLTANHPEKWDIWRNGAWPFSFSVKPDFDIDGGWLKIQHSNAQDGVNRLSLIASTCDFSNNSSIDNNFGKRNNCYAARPDFEYTGRSSTAIYNGSAIFFKIDKLKKDQAFYLTVWAFANNCGGDDFNKYDLINNLSNSSVKFSFTASVYADINTNVIGEDRLTNPYAVSPSTPMTNTCFNAMIQGSYNSLANSFDKNLLQTITIDNAQTVGTRDIALFREIYDWGIGYQDSICNNCWANDISSNGFSEQFLYSKTDRLNTGSYFLLRSSLKKNAGDNTYQFLASGYSYMGNNDSVINSKWVFRFSKNWFVPGDGNCYLSWGFNYGNLNSQLKLFNSDFLNMIQNAQNNLISTATTVNGQLGTINMSESFMIDSEEGFKITTVKNDYANPKFSISNLLNAPNSDSEAILGLFTNCLKWRTADLPNIKSLYTYIDIQWQWVYIGNSVNKNQPTKNNRFIKLFPEGGVFQNYKSIDDSALSIINPITVHYAWQDARSDGKYTGICMIELNGQALSRQYTIDSNTLGIWLYHATLFETDYKDTSATYPLSPLASGIKAYSLQSAVPQSSENQIYSNIASRNMINAVINDLISTNRTYNKSYYQFMLGSFLLLTKIDNNNPTNTQAGETKNNLFIPIYCPIIGNDYFTHSRLPSITAAWMTMSSFSSNISLNRFIGYKRGGTSTVITLNSDSNKLNISGKFTSAALKFNQYSSINPEDENTLFIFNSTKNAAGRNTDCSAHLLFINSKMNFKASDLEIRGLIDPKGYLYTGTTKFYIYGKEFSSAFLTSSIGTNMNAIAYNSVLSPYYARGITRPAADKLYDLLLDSLAYSCVSSRFEEGGALTNLINDNSYNFIVDFNSELNTYLPNVTLSADKNEDNYTSDIASHYKLTFSTPRAFPARSVIIFKTDLTPSTDSICGIYENKYSSQCTIGTVNGVDNTITCTTSTPASNFQICCYGYKVKPIITLLSLSVSLPTPLILTNYISQTLFSIEKQIADSAKNPFTLTNTLSSNSLARYARVTSINYLNVAQSFGLGYAKIAILFPREPVRNMKLSIFGDFKDFALKNITTNCFATFDDTSETDVFVEKCDIRKIYDISGTIDVTFKNFIYRCGMSFSKTMIIYLYPVRALNYGSDTYKNKTYRVAAFKNSEALLDNTQENKFTASNLLGSPLKFDQWDTLCPVTSITPSIPGEIAEYIFNFNLDAYKDEFIDTKPNELQIFYDSILYDLSSSDIGCYVQDNIANCEVSMTGIMTIRYQTDLPFGSGTPIIVKLTGVRNPELPNSHRFGCSINYSNWSTGIRTQLITGSGKVYSGISMRALRIGQLRVYPTQDVEINNVQRKISNHYFRVSIDQITSISNGSFTIDKTPVFYINFPQAYMLGMYTTNITASIFTLFHNESNKLVETVLAITSIVVSSNRIAITIKDSIIVSDKWSHFYITLIGINNPQDSYDKNISTGAFIITLTNSDESIVFRTHSNLNTQYTSISNSLITSPYINYTRGNIFSTDISRYIIDIDNYIKLTPGRFQKYSMSIRKNPSIKQQANSFVSLKDTSLFVMMNDIYELSSVNPDGNNFYIGLPCNSIPGNYILQFSLKSDHPDLFAPLPIIMAYVDNSAKGTINYIAGKTVPLGGSLWVQYDISEPNVDALIISWTKNSLNDSTANLTAAQIPKRTMPRSKAKINNPFSPTSFSVFSITNKSKIDNLQTFTTRSPNNCYSWTVNSISFEINGQPADITPSYDMSNDFKFYNFNQDSTLSHNSIALVFNPPVAPAYLYCSLMCTGSNIPSTESITGRFDNTERSQNYKTYIENNKPITILFDKLLRNLEYRIACVLESTQADRISRTGTKMVKTMITQSLVLPDGRLKTADTYQTICSEMTFNGTLSNQSDILNRCQLSMSAQGYSNNGCQVCADNEGQYTSPGIYLSDSQCVKQQVTSRLRLLQTVTQTISNSIQINTTNTTPVVTKQSFKLCLVQNPNCATNPTVSFDEYKNRFNNLINSYNNSLESSIPLQKLSINKVISYNDTMPDLKKLKITSLTYNMNGYIKWAATYDTPLKCKWMYRSDSFISSPTFDYVWNCLNTNCGTIYVNSNEVFTSTDRSKLFGLEYDSRYNLYYACYSDIPNPVNGNVAMVSSFTTPWDNRQTSTTIAGCHYSYGFFALLLLMMFL